MKKKAFILTLAALLCALAVYNLGLSGPARRADGAGPTSRPNVVFIVIDTLRADHLSFYGYPHETAPFLASLASRSAVFERAFSSSSWTAPAMASVFTSLLPSQHGVTTGFMVFQNRGPRQTIELNALPRHVSVMGERFREAGYKLFGVADNLNIGEEMGFTRGFDRFETRRYQGAPTVNAKVEEWMPEIKAAAPYFLYLHYMDPHLPYHKRTPWFKEGKDRLQTAINAYDSEIRYADEHIKELFELFGWSDDTVVVFLSDHGEEFREHGRVGHGQQLYTESIHVPLVISLPGTAPRRVADFVQIIDILPTLCEALGLPMDPAWRGRSLLPELGGVAGRIAAPIFSELLRPAEHGAIALRSVIAAELHLIEEEWESASPKSELYDLVADFGERENLLPEAEVERTELRARFEMLAAHEIEKGESVSVEMGEEEIEKLKALGYVQ